MQKIIFLLGGSYGQLPAIVEAKKRGLYTILCDYLPDNPGRVLADQYYEVSTTDKSAVLKIAKDQVTLPVAEGISARVLCLPLFHELTPEEISHVSTNIVKALKSNS